MAELFDGPSDPNDPAHQREPRLKRQLVQVYEALLLDDLTLEELSAKINAPTSSVSARIRDLRKPRFGDFRVDREHLENGLYRYMLRSETGNPDLVYDPLPNLDNRRLEARRRVIEWLNHVSVPAFQAGSDGPVMFGERLLIEDLHTLCR